MPTMMFSVSISLRLHFFAGQGVKARDDEEENDDGDIDKVAHKILVQSNSVMEATWHDVGKRGN